MRKLNATLLNENSKEEAILKIKDDSFAIDTNEQITKIAYSNIKSYEYDDNEEILTIEKFGGNSIKLNIVKDKQLLELLSNLVIQNKNNKQKIDIADIESASLKGKSAKIEENTTNINEKKAEIKQNNEKKEETNNSDFFVGLITIVVIIGIVFFGAKSLFFSNSSEKKLQGDVLGTYQIRNTNDTVIVKEDSVSFRDLKYEVKDVDSQNNFNMYLDGEKKYDCVSSAGLIMCTGTANYGLLYFLKISN